MTNIVNLIKAELRLLRNYREDSPLVPEIRRLMNLAEKHDNSNIALRETIAECKLEDPSYLPSKYSIAVHIWGRDCDQMEVSYTRIIGATVLAFLRAESELHDNAEGPCGMSIMTEQEYNDFEPSQRDRRAEQYNY